jgi:Delta7-sterol 5-desaturase
MQPIAVWLSMVLFDGARYFIAAGVAFVVFWVWKRERYRRRIIPRALPDAKKMWHDVRWSLSTIVIFATVGTAIFFGHRHGVFRRYDSIASHGWPWLLLSIVLLVVLHDTYFYWTHRAMHHRWLFRHVHRVHHASSSTSPWTAYAFSPLEAIVHAAFLPAIWLVVPLHEVAVFVFLVFMIVRNVLGHLSIELYSRGFTQRSFLGLHTTTTHHALHHQSFDHNYGLYFTFWDRVMGTTHPRYDEVFERVTGAGPR